MRPPPLLAAVLVAASAAAAPAAPAAAQTVLTDYGTPHVALGPVTATTSGPDLTGTRVTAYWDGGATVREYVWGYESYAEGSYGVHTLGELMLLWSGWLPTQFTLVNLAATPLERLVLDAAPAQVVFDRALAPALGAGTPGSNDGLDLVFGTPGPVGSTVTYRNAVQLPGEPAAGDLFTTIDLWFGPSGLMSGPFTTMNLDADRAATAPASTVPEPATWGLLGTGLAALGGATRRRRPA